MKRRKQKTLRVLKGFFYITGKETVTKLAHSYLFFGLLKLRYASG